MHTSGCDRGEYERPYLRCTSVDSWDIEGASFTCVNSVYALSINPQVEVYVKTMRVIRDPNGEALGGLVSAG